MTPTPKEAQRYLQQRSVEWTKMIDELMVKTRAAVHTLRDRGMESTAADLEAQLFALETHTNETMAEVAKHPAAFMEGVRDFIP
jgi:uncharacterized protein (DUF2267 family)